MFPTDPRAPGGPDRSEYVHRGYGRTRRRRRFRLFSLAEPAPSASSGWPPVRQMRPLGSTPARNNTRSAALP